MALYKFTKDDLLNNVIVANPKMSFRIFAGNVYINGSTTPSGLESINALEAAPEVVGGYLYDFSDPKNSFYLATI